MFDHRAVWGIIIVLPRYFVPVEEPYRMIDKATIEGLKSSIDLRDIIEGEGKQQANGSIKMQCPFPDHHDKDPSFFVFPEYFICFGCGKRGDAFEYKRLMEGKSFPEAAKDFAQLTGIDIDFEDEEKLRKWQEFTSNLKDKNDSFVYELWINEDILQGLQSSRNLNEETIAKFQLGYSKEHNAITIPFFDASQRIVNIIYRSLKENGSKYFYDKDVSEAASNGDIPKWSGNDYWFNESELIHHQGIVYIAEGPFDIMTLVQHGLSAVGYHGSKISSRQLSKLRGARPVKIVFCPDNKTQNDIKLGYSNSIMLRDSVNCPMKVVWPNGDINDTKENLDEVLDNEMQAELAFLSVVFEGDEEEQRKRAKDYVSQIKDVLARDDVIQRIAERWDKDKKKVENFLEIKNTDIKIISVHEALDAIEELAIRRTTGQYIDNDDFAPFFSTIGGGHIAAIAARTGIGKTNFLLNLIKDVQNPANTLFVSLEQPATEIMLRLISIMARECGSILSSNAIKKMVSEDIPQGEWTRLRAIIEDLLPNLHMYDNPLTISGLRDIIRVAKDSIGDNLIVMIDYLALLKTDRNISDSYQRMTNLALSAQEIAKELDVMILFAQQLSRAGGHGEVPVTLDMLRDSGSIEEVCDLILGIYKNTESTSNIIGCNPLCIDVIKNRHGPSGHLEYVLDTRTLSYLPVDHFSLTGIENAN